MKPAEQNLPGQDDVVDGEIIAEFEDGTLLNLPKVKSREDAPSRKIDPAAAQFREEKSGRRLFIRRLLLGGTAALALGGSAALLLSQTKQPNVIVLPDGKQVAIEGSPDVANLAEQIATLQKNLTDITSERDRLLSDLTSLSTELEDAKTELERLRSENSLWQVMDETGLDDLLEKGLQVLSVALSALLALNKTLISGISVAESSITSFIKLLPSPSEGIQWLQGQVIALSSSLLALKQLLEEVVDPVEPYTQMVSNFVVWILDRLPFGIGAKAKAGLEQMQSIINALPSLVDGVNTSVLNPLSDWLGSDAKANLNGILLDPVTTKLLKPAKDAASEVTDFANVYDTRLAAPVQAALAKRAEIRTQLGLTSNTTGGTAQP
jgi:hypothetical protein